MQQLKQSQTAQKIVFLLIQSADHISPLTGATPTVTLSKNGGAFAAAAGAVSEVGNGLYALAGNATDTNTLGSLALHATATGADPADKEVQIVAFDPLDAVHFGLTSLPNANAGTNGGLPLADANGRTSANVQQIGGQTATASGAVNFPNATVGTSTFAGGAVASVTAGVTLDTTAQTNLVAAIWNAGTRTLTSLGTLLDGIPAAVKSAMEAAGSYLTLTKDQTTQANQRANVQAVVGLNGAGLTAIGEIVANYDEGDDNLFSMLTDAKNFASNAVGSANAAKVSADAILQEAGLTLIANANWGYALESGADASTALNAIDTAISQGVITDDEKTAIATALLDLANGVEPGETLRQALRGLRAALRGKTTVNEETGETDFLRKDGTTVAFSGISNEKGERISVTDETL